ncbi:Hypothetical protein A7982_01226 [Minicystis rosea]|nr:Hypothetical protein A7982_01226 [Minicystis rosea]
MIGKVAVPASAFAPYCAERLDWAKALRSNVFTPLPHDRVLACRLALAFERGVARLEPHPDDDPRWARCFAASVKRGEEESFIEDLLNRRLQACPGDDDVRWLRIAFTLFLGDNSFAADLFRALVVGDPTNLRWLIAGAVWVYALSGVDTSIWLRDELLLLQDVLPDVAGAIKRLQGTDDTHARWIATIGMSVYEGAALHDMSQAGVCWRGFPRPTS